MSHRTSSWTRFGVVRRYPFDLAAVSIGAALAYAIVTTFGSGNSLRLLAAGPLALFFPGYALVSVLFPARERDAREATATAADARPRGIDATERMGLAFVVSIAIVPVTVMVLSITSYGLTATSIAAALGLVTIGMAQLGTVRRLRTPAGERFTVSPIAWLGRFRSDDNAGATASSVLLVVAIGAAVGALLVGFLMPVSAGGYTELGLYSENEDGETVAGDLPSEIAPGESIPLTIAIENQEGHDQNYTVVVQEQVLEDGEVVERTRLRRIETNVSDGATATGERSVTPTAEAGETVRISVLLYYGEPPETPTNGNAAEETYFWVSVTE